MKMIFLVQHIFLFESERSDMLFTCYFHVLRCLAQSAFVRLVHIWNPKRYMFSLAPKIRMSVIVTWYTGLFLSLVKQSTGWIK